MENMTWCNNNNKKLNKKSTNTKSVSIERWVIFHSSSFQCNIVREYCKGNRITFNRRIVRSLLNHTMWWLLGNESYWLSIVIFQIYRTHFAFEFYMKQTINVLLQFGTIRITTIESTHTDRLISVVEIENEQDWTTTNQLTKEEREKKKLNYESLKMTFWCQCFELGYFHVKMRRQVICLKYIFSGHFG